MEAVGAAAAIVQLIELALKTSSCVYGAYKDIRDAKETHKRLLREMRDLVRTLDQLLDAVLDANEAGRGKDSNRHIQALDNLLRGADNVFTVCGNDIQEILHLLQASTGSSLSWPTRKGKIDRVLVRIAATKEQLGFAIQTQSMATILDIRRMLEKHESLVRNHIQSESSRAVIKWLDPPDVWKNLRNALQKRQPGTGEWLLETSIFKAWKTNPGFMWLSGMPGAGKTIMSSTIVASLLNEAQHSASAVLYSYFDFSRESQQQTESLLRTCLAQLASKSPEAFDIVADLRNRCSKTGTQQPVLEEFLSATISAMATLPTVFVVVDALDECQDRLALFTVLKAFRTLSNVHIAVLSRREHDIQRAISSWGTELPLEGAQVQEDIVTYIRHRIRDSEDMQEWSEKDRMKVEYKLGQMAGGMFRWVQCQLDSLQTCIDSTQVEETLASLPTDLPSTYERILVNLDTKSASRVRDVLTALAFSRRPLKIDEIIDIVSISTAYPLVRKENSVYLNQLLSLCSSLVTVSTNGTRSKKKQEMRLAHASVRDYLVSEQLRNGPAATFAVSSGEGHRVMAEKGVACLLLHDDVDNFGPQVLEEVPFLLYASLNWTYHAKEANAEVYRGTLDELVFALFHKGNDAYINWHRITGIFGPMSPVEGLAWNIHLVDGKPATREKLLDRHAIDRPLLRATQWNLWHVVGRLLDAGYNPNAFSKGNRTAFHLGVQHEAYESMELILGRGGNINIRDWSEATPAHICASETRNPKMMSWLMKHGAKAGLHSFRFGGLLHVAAMAGDPDVPAAILSSKEGRGTVTDCFEHYHNEVADLATPLQCAAYGGHLECIDLLLKHGARVNDVCGKMGTALHAAAAGGKPDAAELLLQRGANTGLSAGQYGSVIWAAGHGSNRACVRFFLDNVVSPDVVGTIMKETPTNDMEALITMIIEVAVNRYCRDILEAARRGLTDRVAAFLDASTSKQVDLERGQFIFYRSPLAWAAAEGHLPTVQYLASQGAKLDTYGRQLETPLELACLGGHLEVVKCLLSLGCRADFRHRGKYKTAFVCADISGNRELVEFLTALDENEASTFEFGGSVYGRGDGMRYWLRARSS